jgi:hypothetical protein
VKLTTHHSPLFYTIVIALLANDNYLCGGQKIQQK